jgi:predicted GIY-YIG superfamily endonuclease
MNTWYCYIIKSFDEKYSYNGSTNNPVRRLRQHNGEICGGAYRTKKARPWHYYAILKGLPNHINALSAEWRIRYPSNKRQKEAKYKGINGRIVGLNEVLKLDQWTNQCKIKNKDMNLELFILKDYVHLIDDLPNYIKINIVDHIDPKEL